MRNDSLLVNRIDWPTILMYMGLVLLGWFNIYAAVYDPDAPQSIFNTTLNSGKQLIWIATCVVLIIGIFIIDFNFFNSIAAYIIYGIIIFMLLLVLVAGTKVGGARSWFDLGSFRLQPSEFAKFATALALAKYFGDKHVRLNRWKHALTVLAIIFIPMALIILQPDAGTAMVFAALGIVLYREGLSTIIVLVGLLMGVLFVLTLLVDKYYLIGTVAVIALLIMFFTRKKKKSIGRILLATGAIIIVIFSVEYVLTDVLKPHQQKRIQVLFNPNIDPLGAGWNVTQSKIAIGSGGLAGKGFLEGTQTKFDFVPEQSTDFIFCTIGEEHGWIGSVVLVVLFMAFLFRIVQISERQKSTFARVYGYSVASIIFFHFAVNIGMTIGLFPVIGIPLPFFSYGGSALWSFTILVFILIKLDAHRMQVLQR